MRSMEMIATVTADGLLTVALLTAVVPGAHAVVVEIDERALSAESHDEDDWLPFVQGECEGRAAF